MTSLLYYAFCCLSATCELQQYVPTLKHCGYINILHRSSMWSHAAGPADWGEGEKKERKSSRRLLVLAPLASTIQLPSTTLAAWIFTRIFIRRTSRTGYPIAPSKLTISSLPLIGMTQFFRKYRVLMPSVPHWEVFVFVFKKWRET